MCVKGQPQLLHFPAAFVNLSSPSHTNHNNNSRRASLKNDGIENKNKTNRSPGLGRAKCMPLSRRQTYRGMQSNDEPSEQKVRKTAATCCCNSTDSHHMEVPSLLVLRKGPTDCGMAGGVQ